VSDDTARAVANVLIASAGAAAAYIVLSQPRLRRLALQGLQFWLGASVPVYLLNQVRYAWVESGQRA
jgi:hypothetical protein